MVKFYFQISPIYYEVIVKSGVYYISLKGRANPEKVIADRIIEPLQEPVTGEDTKYLLVKDGEIVASYEGHSVEGWRREEMPHLRTPIVVG